MRAGADGFAVTREEEKLGLNSSSTADLVFEDTPGRAARRAGQGHARSRCGRSTAAGSGSPPRRSGSRRPALELATSYAKERHAFGGPIARLGAIQQKLADMQTEIEAARALVWRAARLKEAGRPHTVEGAQAKLFASRGRAPPDRRGDPGPRRLRLHEGVPGRALLPRREGHRDLRGDERDPAARDRARAARRGDARWMTRRSRSSRPRRGRRGWTSTTSASDGIWIKFAKKASGIPSVTYKEVLPSRARLRVDRRPGQAHRRRLVPPALDAAPRAHRVVEDQPRRGRGDDRARRDEAGRAARGRAREGRRALGGAPTTRRPRRRCPTTCAPRSTPTRPPPSSSRGSTRSTATRSCTASRAPKKPETRAHRIAKFVAMCSRGETVHPPRRAAR